MWCWDLLGHNVKNMYVLKGNFPAIEKENDIFQREVIM